MNPKHKNNSESGQVIILLAFLMIVLLGFAGLAIDGGNLLTQRRRGQNAVDNAALSYALSMMRNNNNTTTANTDASSVLTSNGYTSGSDGTTVYIPTPSYSSAGGTVLIVMTATVPSAFIHIVYNGPIQYTVQAQAEWEGSIVPMSGFAIVGLATTCDNNTGVLDTNGGGNSGGLRAYGGNMFMNVAGNATCGIDAPNSANNLAIGTESPYGIVSVGSYNYGNPTYTSSGGIQAPVSTGYNGGVSVGDPLAGLAEPTCSSSSTRTGPSGNRTYTPGNILGSDIDGGTLNPGIYCITGDLTISGNNTLIGTGVTLYFIDGGMNFTGNGGMSLSAPTNADCLGTYGLTTSSCTYKGMAIFVSRTNTSTIGIRGNGDNAIEGTIYGINATIEAKGGGASTDETDIVGQVIVKRVQGGGNGSFNITYQEPAVYHPPPAIRLTK